VVLNKINFTPHKLIDNIVNLYSADLTQKHIALELKQGTELILNFCNFMFILNSLSRLP
jgi:hypothetical protein